MSIKDRLRVIEPDKANHYYYGSQAAAVGASIVAVLCVVLLRQWFKFDVPMVVISLVVSAAVAFASAWVAGKVSERLDKKANDATGTNTREVSAEDVKWTARGGIPVALPMIVLAIVIALTGR